MRALAVSLTMAAAVGSCRSASTVTTTMTPGATLADTYSRTESAKSFDVTLHSTGGTPGRLQVATGSGFVSYGPLNERFSVHTSGPGPTTNNVETLIVDGQLFVGVPAQEAELLGGKTWIEQPTCGGLTGWNLSFPSPTTELQTLRSRPSSSVAVVGHTTIGGVATLEYRVEYNIATAAHAPVPRGTVPPDLVLRVWIDQSGLTRQIVQDYAFPPGLSEPGGLHVQYDFTNFGGRVPLVKAPPASEISNGTGPGILNLFTCPTRR